MPRKTAEASDAQATPTFIAVPADPKKMDRGWVTRLLALIVREGVEQGKLDGRCLQQALELLCKVQGLLSEKPPEPDEGVIPEVLAYLKAAPSDAASQCP